MTGTLLRFYVHENRRHHHVLLYDWLLEEAKKLGIRGGSAFRAIAGFGRHGILHAEHFFELAGDVDRRSRARRQRRRGGADDGAHPRRGHRHLLRAHPVEFGSIDD